MPARPFGPVDALDLKIKADKQPSSMIIPPQEHPPTVR